MPLKPLVQVTDARGLSVSLFERQFFDHIAVRHNDFNHCWPFSANRSQACLMTCNSFLCLEEAILHPLELRRDKLHDNRDNYYGPPVVSLAAQGMRNAYLKVCVEFNKGRGRVITAFSTDIVSPDDRPLVPR